MAETTLSLLGIVNAVDNDGKVYTMDCTAVLDDQSDTQPVEITGILMTGILFDEIRSTIGVNPRRVIRMKLSIELMPEETNGR